MALVFAAATSRPRRKRLLALTGLTKDFTVVTTASYAFGNRTSKTDAAGATVYSYAAADRITSVTPPSPASAISYTWDNNGDLTGRGGDSFAWDYEDRMTSATVNSTTTTFAYRGDGLRNSRTMGGVTTTFTWDIAGGLPVVLDDGAQYVYGAGLVSQVSGANTYYYLADGLGSTMKTVDATGAVVNGYTYDIYGKKTSSTGSQPNEFDFAGQQTDPTGLQYLRARYYDPETGTFMSRDPMSASPGWSGNPLGYAGGNAVSRADPTGLVVTGDDVGDLFDAATVDRVCFQLRSQSAELCDRFLDIAQAYGLGSAPLFDRLRDAYYRGLVKAARPTLGEYHQTVADCARDSHCREEWDGFFQTVQGLDQSGPDQAVRSASEALGMPLLGRIYTILRYLGGAAPSQVWAAYKHVYGNQ